MSSCWHGHAPIAGLAWARGKQPSELVGGLRPFIPVRRDSPDILRHTIHFLGPSFVPCLRALLLLPVLLFLFVAVVRQAVRSEGVVLPQVISRSLFVWSDSHEIRRRVVRHSQQGSKYGAEFADRQFAECDHS